MNLPILPEHRTPTGWADDRLMNAYDLIWEVQQANKALGIEPDFRNLLKQIEDAAAVLTEARKDASNA